MAGIDLSTAESKLALWLAAEEKVAAGQSVTHEGRSLTRADLGEIANRVAYWDAYCKRLSRASGGGGVGLTRIVSRG